MTEHATGHVSLPHLPGLSTVMHLISIMPDGSRNWNRAISNRSGVSNVVKATLVLK